MIIDKFFIKNILLTFIFMNLLFMILIVLGDIFINLFNYLENNVTIQDIIYIYFLYLPKAFSDGIVLSFLFAVSNLIGNLSMRNEIIGLYSCGISLLRILRPIIVISVFLSIALFFFDNYFVIDSMSDRDVFIKTKVRKDASDTSSEGTVIIRNFSREIYNIRYYDASENSLSHIMIILRSKNNDFTRRYDIGKANWISGKWKLYNVREFINQNNVIKEVYHKVLNGEGIINLELDYVKTIMLSSKSLDFSKLIAWIEFLKKQKLDYSQAELDFLDRIFFSFRLIFLSFVISFISLALKKNIFILSLLNSIAFAVVYIMSTIVFNFLADLGYLHIYIASSFTTLLFLLISLIIYKIIGR